MSASPLWVEQEKVEASRRFAAHTCGLSVQKENSKILNGKKKPGGDERRLFVFVAGTACYAFCCVNFCAT